MIILITGTPGSGKTLYAVHKVKEWLESGREVYADIDGLTLQGVQPAPEDWRDTPDGSVVVYDEAQQHERFKKQRSTLSDDPIIQALEVHRHTGHDIVFITQSPQFLSKHICELVGEHYHLHRAYGAPLATVYLWRTTAYNPNTVSAKERAENKTHFQHDKKLFRFYKSASVHTHKMAIPRAVFFYAGLALCCMIGVYKLYLHPNTQSMVNAARAGSKPGAMDSLSSKTAATASEGSSGSSAVGVAAGTDSAMQSDQVLQALELNRPALIVSDSSGLCIAKNRYGMPLATVTADQCARLAASPGRLMYGTVTDNTDTVHTAQPAPLVATPANTEVNNLEPVNRL